MAVPERDGLSKGRPPRFSEKAWLKHMLTLLPILFILIASVIALLVYVFHWRVGIIWLSAITASFLAWVLILVYHFMPVIGLNLINWSPLNSTAQFIAYQFDTVSWPLVFSLVTILLTILLTYPTVARDEKKPARVASVLLLFFSSLLATLSATPVAFLLSWTLYDFIDGLILVKAGLSDDGKQALLLNLFMKIFSSCVLVWSLVISSSEAVLTIGQYSQKAVLIIIVAVCIRVWSTLLIPIDYHLRNISKEFSLARLLTGTVTALAILGRLSGQLNLSNTGNDLQLIISLIALLGGFGWLFAGTDQKRLSSWLFTVSSIAILSAIRGDPGAAVIWVTVMILIGPAILIFSPQSKSMYLFPIIGLVGLSGLPLTLASPGWSGITQPRVDLFSVIFLLSYVLLLMGLIKISVSKFQDNVISERWMVAMNTAGLSIATAVQLTIIFLINRALPIIKLWWMTIIPIVLAVLLYLIFKFQIGTTPFRVLQKNSIFIARFQSIEKKIQDGLILKFIYMVFVTVYRIFRRAINGIEGILEGNAGVIWAALLLVMILTMLQKVRTMP